MLICQIRSVCCTGKLLIPHSGHSSVGAGDQLDYFILNFIDGIFLLTSFLSNHKKETKRFQKI